MMSSLSCGCVSTATCCHPQPPQPSRACTHGGSTRASDASSTSTTRPRTQVGFVGGDLDADPLAGERAVDQRDAPVVDPAERVTAGNHARRRQFHPDSQARSLRDSRIVKALRVHELGEPEQVMVLEDAPEPDRPAR